MEIAFLKFRQYSYVHYNIKQESKFNYKQLNTAKCKYTLITVLKCCKPGFYILWKIKQIKISLIVLTAKQRVFFFLFCVMSIVQQGRVPHKQRFQSVACEQWWEQPACQIWLAWQKHSVLHTVSNQIFPVMLEMSNLSKIAIKVLWHNYRWQMSSIPVPGNTYFSKNWHFSSKKRKVQGSLD